MIRYADKNMVLYLKEIWRECFGDSESYIDFFFENNFNRNKILVWLEDGKPVSMLTLIKASIYINYNYVPIWYVYAVATQKAYRGLGISTKLLNFINNPQKNSIFSTATVQDDDRNKSTDIQVPAEVAFSMLVPADKGLFSYYKKRGYTDYFYIQELEILRVDCLANDIVVIDLLPGEYKVLRDTTFKREGYISWDEESISYIICENEFTGGKAQKIIYKDKEYGIIFYVDKSILYVKEITCIDKELNILVQKFMKIYNCKMAIVRMPNYADILNLTQTFSNIKAKKRKFGMVSENIFGIIKDNNVNKNLYSGYINLVLD